AAHKTGKARVEGAARMENAVFQEPARRQQKAEKDRQQAGKKGKEPPPRREAVAADGEIAPRVVEFPPAAIEALNDNQRKDEQHQDGGKLRRGGRLAKPEPGPVDAGRKGVDGEIL